MVSLLDLTFSELAEFVTTELKEPPFRAKQLWIWLWRKRAKTFEEMTDLSLAIRAKLTKTARICWPEVVTTQTSNDGTIKFLLKLEDGALVETVLIPSESKTGKRRLTQCLSTQVGCAMGCTFCSTGTMGLVRNMTVAEITGQVLAARDFLNDDPSDPALRNLVFMGMGEPLHNFTNLMKSLDILNNEQGMAFSARRITVSTSGVQKGLLELGQSGLAYLAVSLHAPTQKLREQIMPRAAQWPLDELIKTLQNYPLETRERLTFEYLLLGGVNDTPQHARELARLLSHIKAKLNLIAYNATPGSPYTAPSAKDILAFQKILWAKGIVATLRKSKGQDIDAACGQLATQHAQSPPASPQSIRLSE